MQYNTIDYDLKLMNEYQLSAEEIMVIHMIFMALYENGGHNEYLKTYYRQLKNITPLPKLLGSLQDKGVILKEYEIRTDIFSPDDVLWNKQFLKNYYKCSEELGGQLFNAYPDFLFSNGKRFNLKNITKYFNSLEDLFYNYGKMIKFNPDIHKHVMEMLEYAKDHNMLNYSICEFILSKKWLEIERVITDGNCQFDYNRAELV